MNKLSYLCCAFLFGYWLTIDRSAAEENQKPITVQQAMKLATEPYAQIGFSFDSRPLYQRLQVLERLYSIEQSSRYVFQDQDEKEWQKLLQDDKASIYARLCAASFLLSKDETARDFVKAKLTSKNVRHRYNAAFVLMSSLHDEKNRIWNVPLLIELVQSGALDGSGAIDTPKGEFPENDQDDIKHSPLEDICWRLGHLKEKKAVPALISVLERFPQSHGATYALGEIGDPRGIPILLEQLRKKPTWNDCEIIALGKMKAKEAVPELTARLAKIRAADGDDQYEAVNILEALLAIADEKTIPLIEECTGKGHSPRVQKTARRVLVQLKATDKVAGLIELLQAESDEYEGASLVNALATQRDPRVTEALAKVARTTDSSLLCHRAICGLGDMGDSASLLELVKLLDHRFPEKMETAFGTRGVTDFTHFFHKNTERCLEQATGQKLGRNRAAWETWIKENRPKTPSP
jgi:HEAT repeat protein